MKPDPVRTLDYPRTRALGDAMGKQSRRARSRCAPVVEQPSTCPVCFESFKYGESHESGDVPDNALACSNGHTLCVGCVSKLLPSTQWQKLQQTFHTACLNANVAGCSIYFTCAW